MGQGRGAGTADETGIPSLEVEQCLCTASRQPSERGTRKMLVKRAGFYLRVWTAEQAEKGWIIEGQYREIRAFCGIQQLGGGSADL